MLNLRIALNGNKSLLLLNPNPGGPLSNHLTPILCHRPRRQTCSIWVVKTLQMSRVSAQHLFHGQLSPFLSCSFPEIYQVLSLIKVMTSHMAYMLFKAGLQNCLELESPLQQSAEHLAAIQPKTRGAVGELLSDISTSSCHSDCLCGSLHYCPQSWLQPHRAPLQEDHMTHCTDTRFNLVTCLPRCMREECHFWAEALRATVLPIFFLPLP